MILTSRVGCFAMCCVCMIHMLGFRQAWMEERKVYIQQEFCDGVSLDKLVTDASLRHKHTQLASGGSNGLEEVVRNVCLQMCEALYHLHASQMVRTFHPVHLVSVLLLFVRSPYSYKG